MRPSKRRWLLITTSLLFVLSTVLVEAVEHDPSINWVPIVDRRPEATNAIEAAFQKTWTDRVTSDKVARIGKMLNNSLDVQEEEMREGRQKLERLKNSTPSTSFHSFLSLLPFTLLSFVLGQ